MKLEPLDILLCKINIRAEYKGRKANTELVEKYQGEYMLMQVLWEEDDNDKYPGEYALRPENKDEWMEMAKITGWISSGDVEIIHNTAHSEKEDKLQCLDLGLNSKVYKFPDSIILTTIHEGKELSVVMNAELIKNFNGPILYNKILSEKEIKLLRKDGIAEEDKWR